MKIENEICAKTQNTNLQRTKQYVLEPIPQTSSLQQNKEHSDYAGRTSKTLNKSNFFWAKGLQLPMGVSIGTKYDYACQIFFQNKGRTSVV